MRLCVFWMTLCYVCEPGCMLTSVFVCPLSVNENWSRALGQGEARMYPWRFHLMEIQCWVARTVLRDTLWIKNVIHCTHNHILAGYCSLDCKWPQFGFTATLWKQGCGELWDSCESENKNKELKETKCSTKMMRWHEKCSLVIIFWVSIKLTNSFLTKQ